MSATPSPFISATNNVAPNRASQSEPLRRKGVEGGYLGLRAISKDFGCLIVLEEEVLWAKLLEIGLSGVSPGKTVSDVVGP
jgi:hypothetical protein